MDAVIDGWTYAELLIVPSDVDGVALYVYKREPKGCCQINQGARKHLSAYLYITDSSYATQESLFILS